LFETASTRGTNDEEVEYVFRVRQGIELCGSFFLCYKSDDIGVTTLFSASLTLGNAVPHSGDLCSPSLTNSNTKLRHDPKKNTVEENLSSPNAGADGRKSLILRDKTRRR
jgi:hypothetical protein